VISDFPVMGDQREVFGLVASVPTCVRQLMRGMVQRKLSWGLIALQHPPAA
jgi:hypothetical protein